MLRRFAAFLLCVLLISLSMFALAQDRTERITRFDTVMTVNTDASMDVTENITVYSNALRMLRGIVRRLPLQYQDHNGKWQDRNYELKEVRIDNAPSSYHVTRSNNLLAIYIGRIDSMLKPGQYTYTLRYHVTNVIKFLEDFDELYWNITGNEWDYPVMQTQATIILPTGAIISRYSIYASKETKLTLTQPGSNELQLSTQQPLAPLENLIVSVVWPKGLIVRPAWHERAMENLESSWLSIFILVLGLIVLASFIIWLWRERMLRKESDLDLE